MKRNDLTQIIFNLDPRICDVVVFTSQTMRSLQAGEYIAIVKVRWVNETRQQREAQVRAWKEHMKLSLPVNMLVDYHFVEKFDD